MRKPMDRSTAAAVAKLLRVSVIITSLLIILQTLGYSISGVLAFGGIGGMAVAFAADREADNIDIGLSRALQVQYIATGRGFLGTSLEYLENTLAQFDRMGIHDPDLSALLADARRVAAEAGVSPAAGVAGAGSAGR